MHSKFHEKYFVSTQIKDLNNIIEKIHKERFGFKKRSVNGNGFEGGKDTPDRKDENTPLMMCGGVVFQPVYFLIRVGPHGIVLAIFLLEF